MRRLAAAAVACVGCGGGSSPGTDELCVVRVVEGGVETDRTEADLVAPERPVTTTLWRDGVLVVRWSFTYDEAGRVVAWDQDFAGPAGPPDGVAETRVAYTHTATSAREDYGGEVVDLELDAADRITRRTMRDGVHRFELAADGAITRSDLDAVDVDTRIPYTRSETYVYADGLPIERTATDSRGASASTTRFAYERPANQLVVLGDGTPARWSYTYDAQGRLVRADDGALVVALAYDGEAVTADVSRDGRAVRTYTYSAACGYAPVAPRAPSSGTRPRAAWTAELPPIPAPY